MMYIICEWPLTSFSAWMRCELNFSSSNFLIHIFSTVLKSHKVLKYEQYSIVQSKIKAHYTINFSDSEKIQSTFQTDKCMIKSEQYATT